MAKKKKNHKFDERYKPTDLRSWANQKQNKPIQNPYPDTSQSKLWKDKRKTLKTGKSQHITHKGTMIQTTDDYSLKIMRVRRSDTKFFKCERKELPTQNYISSKNIFQE